VPKRAARGGAASGKVAETSSVERQRCIVLVDGFFEWKAIKV
jgi:putative SOS response-associated peptidase YedK